MSFLTSLTDMANQGEEGLDNEIACVSAGLGSAGMSEAGLGGGFDHTSELHVMKLQSSDEVSRQRTLEKGGQ